MRLRNLTPHAIRLYTDDGPVDIQSDGVARVDLDRSVLGRIFGVPIYSVSAREVIGLPPPDGYTIYIVSAIVERYACRTDVVTVDKLQRTDTGVVTGAKALARSA